MQQRAVPGGFGVGVQEVGEFEGRPAVEVTSPVGRPVCRGQGAERGGERGHRPALGAGGPGPPGGPCGDGVRVRGEADGGTRREVPDAAFRLVHHVLVGQACLRETGGGGRGGGGGFQGARTRERRHGARP